MMKKSEIIATMCHAVQLIEQLKGENEIADNLNDAIYQLEYEWAAQLKEEDMEEEEG